MRKQWLSAIKLNPEKGVTEICEQKELKRIYKRLHKIDHDWIMGHRPGRKVRKVERGFDWIKRDNLLAEDVRMAVTTILEHSGKPIHITLSEIRRHMKFPQFLLKGHFSKLPKTLSLLEEVLESRGKFYLRRIAWIKKNVHTTGELPNER